MTVKELGEKCRERKTECEECPYPDQCRRFEEEIENISPYGVLSLLQCDVG